MLGNSLQLRRSGTGNELGRKFRRGGAIGIVPGIDGRFHKGGVPGIDGRFHKGGATGSVQGIVGIRFHKGGAIGNVQGIGGSDDKEDGTDWIPSASGGIGGEMEASGNSIPLAIGIMEDSVPITSGEMGA